MRSHYSTDDEEPFWPISSSYSNIVQDCFWLDHVFITMAKIILNHIELKLCIHIHAAQVHKEINPISMTRVYTSIGFHASLFMLILLGIKKHKFKIH